MQTKREGACARKRATNLQTQVCSKVDFNSFPPNINCPRSSEPSNSETVCFSSWIIWDDKIREDKKSSYSALKRGWKEWGGTGTPGGGPGGGGGGGGWGGRGPPGPPLLRPPPPPPIRSALMLSGSEALLPWFETRIKLKAFRYRSGCATSLRTPLCRFSR